MNTTLMSASFTPQSKFMRINELNVVLNGRNLRGHAHVDDEQIRGIASDFDFLFPTPVYTNACGKKIFSLN